MAALKTRRENTTCRKASTDVLENAAIPPAFATPRDLLARAAAPGGYALPYYGDDAKENPAEGVNPAGLALALRPLAVLLDSFLSRSARRAELRRRRANGIRPGRH